jgi:hypothetical protein
LGSIVWNEHIYFIATAHAVGKKGIDADEVSSEVSAGITHFHRKGIAYIKWRGDVESEDDGIALAGLQT